MRDLLTIQERHVRLHTAFSDNSPTVKSQAYQDELTGLLKDIGELAERVDSVQDYLWLRDTVEYWRVASGVLGLQLEITLNPPPSDQLSKKPLAGQILWSDGNLENWLRVRAYDISKVRALEWYAQRTVDEVMKMYREQRPEESQRETEDWNQAELYLAADVIDGRLDLALSLTPSSYARLEGLNGCRWLTGVKNLKAYLRWQQRGGGWGTEAKTDDYVAACQQVRDALLDTIRKAPQSTFEPCQRYIEKEFLNVEGKLDLEKAKTRTWLHTKSDVAQSWAADPRAAAERYMRGFYENISPAVLRGDAKSTRSVVEALGLRGGFEHNEGAVNCLEMAIAISFLDPVLARHAIES